MNSLDRGFDKQPLYVRLILLVGMPIALIGPFMLLDFPLLDGIVAIFASLGIYLLYEYAKANADRKFREEEKRHEVERQRRKEAREVESRDQAMRRWREAAEKEAAEKAAAEKERERQRLVVAIKSLPAEVISHYREAAKAITAASDAQREAEAHFAAGAYTPFWESIEYSLDRLTAHCKEVDRAAGATASHVSAVRQLASEHPSTQPAVVGAVIPAGVAEIGQIGAHDVISRRITELTYEAQKDRDFAFIYEQRRTTAAVFQGFRSVSHAVSSLSAEIRTANRELVEAIRHTTPNSTSNPLMRLRL